MKLLILLLAVLGGVWLWKRGRRLEQSRQAPPRRKGRQEVQPMLSCPVCGVHVPQTDAVKGQRGSYCSAAHRRQAEGA
ncbi:MAG: PP0621 family protein [Ottowia sp.]|uniref:PP0621 family protein n=1 Tax=Ottowia sp. TaxID=1898956 RepID=UPI003C77024A